MSQRDKKKTDQSRQKQAMERRVTHQHKTDELLERLMAQVPSRTPMELFLVGVSHEMGFGGKQNDRVRQEAARRLEVFNKPVEEQVWKWDEASISPEMIKVLPEGDVPDKIMVCDFYEVWMRDIKTERWPMMVYLSIKRRFTKEVIRDWRHLQKIKNELVGPENEAVELFPAESRLVDTSNQYHLWVLKDAGQRFPFGYNNRMVASYSALGAQQRSFDA